MVNEQLVRFIEEQNQRLSERKKPETFGVWKTRKNREHDLRVKQANKETMKRAKEQKKRVEEIIETFFLPEVNGQVRQWNDVVAGKTTCKDAAKDFEFTDCLSKICVSTPISEMTDEMLLNNLSQYLPGEKFEVFFTERDWTSTYYTFRFLRMAKP